MIDAPVRNARLLTSHALLFLILFGRRPEVLTKAQFWAEDGAVFFADQLRLGFFHALSSTYAGYYHVVPRLIAAAASGVPVRWAPLAYNLSALAVASLCSGLFAWPMFRHLIASDVLRIATCLVFASGVYTGNEVIGNVTNLQWFLLIAALLLLSYQQRSEADPAWLLILLAIVDLLIALSAPLMLILTPWLLWQAATKKGLARLPALCGLAGVLIELGTFLRSNEPHSWKIRLSSIFAVTIATEISRPILQTLCGHDYLSANTSAVASKFLAALMLVSAGLARLYATCDRHGRQILSATLYFSISLIAVVMLGRNLGSAFLDPYGFRHLEVERYFLVPAFLFVFTMAFCIDHVLRARNAALKAALLVALFSYGISKNFSLPALVDLSWGTYAPKIEDWEAKRKHGDQPPRLTVPINPVPFTIMLY